MHLFYMKKSVILGVVILAIGVGLWLLMHTKKPVPAGTALPSQNVSPPAAPKVEPPAEIAVKKPEAVAVVRPATSKVMTNSSVGLVSVPSSQCVTTDGLLVEEDLAASDGTVRLKKKYNYSADKILTQELEIRVSDGVMTTVNYLITKDGKVLVQVTDEKGRVQTE